MNGRCFVKLQLGLPQNFNSPIRRSIHYFLNNKNYSTINACNSFVVPKTWYTEIAKRLKKVGCLFVQIDFLPKLLAAFLLSGRRMTQCYLIKIILSPFHAFVLGISDQANLRKTSKRFDFFLYTNSILARTFNCIFSIKAPIDSFFTRVRLINFRLRL